jgi:hypothetical protein
MNFVVILVVLVCSVFTSTTWWCSRLLLKCNYFRYTCLWVWLGRQNSIPIFWKVILVMMLPVSLCCYVLDSSLIDNLSQAWQYWRTSLCIVGHQYFACKILQIVILNEKCPPLTPCIPYSIMGISESSRQRLKTGSWSWQYNLPCTKEKRKVLKASFFFCYLL